MIKYFYLFAICLVLSCQTNAKKVVWDVSSKDSYAFEWSGLEMGINKLAIKSDSEGNGFVKLVYHGQNEMHYGEFIGNPNENNFSFIPNQSLSVTLQKSSFYESNTLDIYPKNIKKPLKIKVDYIKTDDSFTKQILKQSNDLGKVLIEMKNFKNKEDCMVSIAFLDSKFNLEPLNFNYYYTGIELNAKPSFNKIKFSKINKDDSIKVVLENEGKEISSKTYLKN